MFISTTGHNAKVKTGDNPMKTKITATEIKAKVKALLKAYGRKLNDKEMPHFYNDKTANMAIAEAQAYLNDSRFEVSPQARKSIESWCVTIRYY